MKNHPDRADVIAEDYSWENYPETTTPMDPLTTTTLPPDPAHPTMVEPLAQGAVLDEAVMVIPAIPKYQ